MNTDDLGSTDIDFDKMTVSEYLDLLADADNGAFALQSGRNKKTGLRFVLCAAYAGPDQGSPGTWAVERLVEFGSIMDALAGNEPTTDVARGYLESIAEAMKGGAKC